MTLMIQIQILTITLPCNVSLPHVFELVEAHSERKGK